MSRIDITRLREMLGQEAEAEHFETIDSTNTYMRKKYAGAIKPAVAVADEQTAGRGRRGRDFYSPAGTGMYMSVLVPTDKFNPVFFTCAVAVIVCRALESQGITAGIKWVNDIIFDGRKICGILCEQISGAIIAGIGLNITTTDFPDDFAKRAGSLGMEIDRTKLCADTANGIFAMAQNPEDYIESYRRLDVLCGKEISYEENGIVFYGTASGITDTGVLIVKTADGIKELDSGEITVREKLI